MTKRLQRVIAAMELEERILNAGSAIAACAVFLPWFSGEWRGGDTVTFTGFGFYTSLMGISIFLLHLSILTVTVVPLLGGPHILRRRLFHPIRLFLSLQATILLIAALSVLTKVTLEFSRIEVRLGVYVCLVGSVVSTLYCYLRFQEQRRKEAQDVFHHPEDLIVRPTEQTEPAVPPPPPPEAPPPLPPDTHDHLH